MYSLCDDRDDEWVLETCVLEILRAVIEDKIHAGELL